MDQRPKPELSVPVTQEHLQVRRETVDTGNTLRLRKQVEETPATVRESLHRDVVLVERVPIGRVVDVAPTVRDEAGVLVVPVLEERLVTRKELVLVEEVRLTCERKVVPVEAEVALRRERVLVERFDPASGQWHAEPAGQEPPGET